MNLYLYNLPEYSPYEKPKDWSSWENCPNCSLKPLIWEFDNGRSTACGCYKTQYDRFHIHAESIMSVHKRTKGKQMTLYFSEDLRDNWNVWCLTGEVRFEHASKRNDGRW